MCELSYNSTYQDSIKASPFEIAYEYEPSMIRKVNSWDLEDNKYSPNAEEFVRRVKLILQQTQDNIVKHKGDKKNTIIEKEDTLNIKLVT